jgi:Fur family transcriptional regulator, ferric uptake regulator
VPGILQGFYRAERKFSPASARPLLLTRHESAAIVQMKKIFIWYWKYSLRLETTVGKLRGRGFKVTPQRLTVLRALAAEQHQSLEEIRARCSEVGLVTIYRTLDLFSEIGALRRLDLGDGPRYELAEDHHHHLICESCGDVSEFDECPLDLRLLKETGFEVNSHSVEIYGRCTNCR